MKKKTVWITRTAAMLAILIVLQWLTKPLGQIVTGSCVNAVLAVTAGILGCGSGLVLALVSPGVAYLLGIAPQLITVPAIMVGNAVFVLLLQWGNARKFWRRLSAWIAAAVAKFGVLYALVVGVICGAASGKLLEIGLLKQPMLAQLSVMFVWPQLITALIGGGVALAVVPLLQKALKRG